MLPIDNDRFCKSLTGAASGFFSDAQRASDETFATLTIEDAVALTALARAVTTVVGLEPSSVDRAAVELLANIESHGQDARALLQGFVDYSAGCRRERALAARARRNAPGSVNLTLEPGAIQLTLPPPGAVERVTTIERDEQRLIRQTVSRDLPVWRSI